MPVNKDLYVEATDDAPQALKDKIRQWSIWVRPMIYGRARLATEAVERVAKALRCD